MQIIAKQHYGVNIPHHHHHIAVEVRNVHVINVIASSKPLRLLLACFLVDGESMFRSIPPISVLPRTTGTPGNIGVSS